jgi:hypothetical protein
VAGYFPEELDVAEKEVFADQVFVVGEVVDLLEDYQLREVEVGLGPRPEQVPAGLEVAAFGQFGPMLGAHEPSRDDVIDLLPRPDHPEKPLQGRQIKPSPINILPEMFLPADQLPNGHISPLGSRQKPCRIRIVMRRFELESGYRPGQVRIRLEILGLGGEVGEELAVDRVAIGLERAAALHVEAGEQVVEGRQDVRVVGRRGVEGAGWGGWFWRLFFYLLGFLLGLLLGLLGLLWLGLMLGDRWGCCYWGLGLGLLLLLWLGEGKGLRLLAISLQLLLIRINLIFNFLNRLAPIISLFLSLLQLRIHLLLLLLPPLLRLQPILLFSNLFYKLLFHCKSIVIPFLSSLNC